MVRNGSIENTVIGHFGQRDDVIYMQNPVVWDESRGKLLRICYNEQSTESRDHMLTPEQIIKMLNLKPLQQEGGFFSEIYRSDELIPKAHSGSYPRSFATSIYYMITPGHVSTMHRLTRTDEIFHFYMGDPVEMLQIRPNGASEIILIGTDLEAGQRPQIIAPRGVWQGARLMPGGRYALLGTSVPLWSDFSDYETGKRKNLISLCPAEKDRIVALTKE